MSKQKLFKLLPSSIRERLVRRAFRLDESAIAALEVSVAETPRDYEAAARLVQALYVKRGIATEHPSGARVTPHVLAPTTAVFVAKSGGEVVGTISLTLDSELGLPMDKIYRDELAPLRARGRRLAEVGALCLAPGHRGTGCMYLLSRIMNDYALRAGCDDLVIAVHPDVADYYRANMLFEQIGAVKTYPGLEKSALAIAMRLDKRTFEDRLLARFAWRHHDASNPWWLWFGRMNAQITPADFTDIGLQRQLSNRRRAAVHLAALRPDVLVDLDGDDRTHLASIVPELRSALFPRTAEGRSRRLTG